MSEQTLTTTDNRTGKSYTLPIENGTVRAMDLRKIKTDANDFGLMTYDPALMNTASTKSAITFIDGDKGILEYRGYPIEQLAESCNYLQVAYLILFGELPNDEQLAAWMHDITYHTFVHENIKTLMQAFRYDAHPMGMFISTVAALSTFYPEANKVNDAENRLAQVKRLIAKVPTIAAFSYRHNRGLPYVYPDNDLTYTGNFLNMMFKMTEAKYTPNPALERALDVLFILHADHEQNCSTNAMRAIGSSRVDPYSAMAGAAAALYGPLHGGANEAVLKMLSHIGDTRHIPEFIQRVKGGEGRLMGFGHRVYKNYDPRARIIKRVAEGVFEVTGRNQLLDIALELERIALEDEYFISRKLYPNVDFYSGIIYQAMGLPVAMFPVMFAIPRTVGWLAQWQEMITDPEQKIARPRQIFVGQPRRELSDAKGLAARAKSKKKMNSRFLLASSILGLLFAGPKSTYAQAEKESGVKEAMRQKVAYSQQVLVGITLEDYRLIANNAEKLVELSNKTNWYSRQMPEYELFLNEFRRNAQQLKEAGQQKNLDAASLAYVQMTLSCVSCHKFIRKSSGTLSH